MPTATVAMRGWLEGTPAISPNALLPVTYAERKAITTSPAFSRESFTQRFLVLYLSSSLTKNSPNAVATIGALTQKISIRIREFVCCSVPIAKLTPRIVPVKAFDRERGTLASSPPMKISSVARSIEKISVLVSFGRKACLTLKSLGPSIDRPSRYPATAIRIPDRLLTILLPMIVPQHAEMLLPLTTAPESPAKTSDRVSREVFKPCFPKRRDPSLSRSPGPTRPRSGQGCRQPRLWFRCSCGRRRSREPPMIHRSQQACCPYYRLLVLRAVQSA